MREYTSRFTQPIPPVVMDSSYLTRSAVHRQQINVDAALRRFSDPSGIKSPRRGVDKYDEDDVAPHSTTTSTTAGPPFISINPVWQLPKKYRDKKKRRQEDMIRLAIMSSSSGNNEGGGGGAVVSSSPAIHQELHLMRKHAFNRSASEGNLDKLWVDTANRNSLSLSSTGQLMDVTLVGKDGVLLPGGGVRASRALLATDSFILEDIFFKNREWAEFDAMESTLIFEYATNDVLRALVYHNFNDKLPPVDDFDISSPTDIVVRKLAQLHHVAYIYKFQNLAEDTNGALRKLINTRVVLACAAFDELSYQHGNGTVDSIKRYALDSIRDMPMDTLLAGGLQWMKEESVEAIILDEEMDVDEFYRFKILSVWANNNIVVDVVGGGEHENRAIAARRLAKHIELKFIDTDLLLSQVQDSGYFDVNTINDAVKARRDSLANSIYEKECVLVEGAGSEIVNGIYCRENDEVGVGEEEILFVKEADDDGYSDIGLYLYGTTWHIAMCADYSNSFYTCQDPLNKSNFDQELVPSNQWVVMAGAMGPAPYCTYRRNADMQGKRMRRSSLAPNLEEMIDPTIVEKRRSHCFDKTKGDVAEKRTMTLEQMMNLPVDQDCDNYE